MSKIKDKIARKVRRNLNKTIDYFHNISGRKLNTCGYGNGVSRKQVNEKLNTNECTE